MPTKTPLFPLHNNQMVINEEALHKGTAFLTQAALDVLSETSEQFLS